VRRFFPLEKVVGLKVFAVFAEALDDIE